MSGFSVPPWADADLSSELPLIAATGETQWAEFKAEFPKQVSDLAKEIAAFATSNAGVVYIGIQDDGTIIGISDGSHLNTRAELVRRIEGICAGPLRPSITPHIRFGIADGLVVAAVEIPKGRAPIYYAGHIPYVRQLTSSRPMLPDEVVDRVIEWHRASNPIEATSPESAFLGDLAPFLVDVDIDLEESKVREIQPWAGEIRSQLGMWADSARRLAARAPRELGNVSEELNTLAEALEIIANEQLTLGSKRLEVYAARNEAEEAVARMRAQWLSPNRFTERVGNDNREALRVAAKLLQGLVDRTCAGGNGFRVGPVQEEVAERGLELLRVASMGVGIGDDSRIDELRQIGSELRALQTAQVVMDGGRSVTRIIERLHAANERFQNWIADL